MARITDRPEPPPRSPFLPPPPRPQLPAASPALQQRAWAGLTLAVLSLLAVMLIGNIQRGVYVIAVALAIAVIAIALAISASSAARRAGTRRPRGALGGTVLGVISFALSGLLLTGFLLFWTPVNQYATCMNGAITVAAQQACQQTFVSSVNTQIAILSGK